MKKISDMSESELMRVCNWYCEEHKLINQWKEYEGQELSRLAIKWCDENSVLYTTKNYDGQSI